MASIQFGGLVLGVIIVSLALKYSSACAQEGVQSKAKWLASIATENHASSQNLAKIAGRKGLVGRNTQKGELLKGGTEEKEGSNPKREISGNDAPKKSMDGAETSHYKNNQDNSNVTQRQELQKEYSPKSTPLFHEHHRQSAHQKDNPKEFLEETDDVVNLMRRDYRGTDRPRRKPPINNHEPSD